MTATDAPEEDVEALQDLLAAEHAAVYAYGALGADLAGADGGVAVAYARACEDTHRARRDRLAALLRDRGVEPVASAPAYRLARPVEDRADALALAPEVEDAVARAAAGGLAPAATPDVRAVLAGSLRDAAVRATRWRLALRASPDVVRPFPGG